MKIKYLALDDVIAIHDNMVSFYGGSHGIRDLGLVDSAVSRPQATFGGQDLYPDVFLKGAALFHSLIFNHAFVDGNKRTSMTSTARFLNMNGYNLDATDMEFVSFPLKVENEHLSFEGIAKWFKNHSRKAGKSTSGRRRIG